MDKDLEVGETNSCKMVYRFLGFSIQNSLNHLCFLTYTRLHRAIFDKLRTLSNGEIVKLWLGKAVFSHHIRRSTPQMDL